MVKIIMLQNYIYILNYQKSVLTNSDAMKKTGRFVSLCEQQTLLATTTARIKQPSYVAQFAKCFLL